MPLRLALLLRRRSGMVRLLLVLVLLWRWDSMWVTLLRRCIHSGANALHTMNVLRQRSLHRLAHLLLLLHGMRISTLLI